MISPIAVVLVLSAATGSATKQEKPKVKISQIIVEEKKNMSSVTDVTGLPPELQAVLPVWEAVYHGTMRAPMKVERLYPDGRLYGYSRHKRVAGDDGLPKWVEAPYAWRLNAKVSAAGIKQISAAIASSEFKALPASAGLPGKDGRALTYRGLLEDGKQKVIELCGQAAISLPAPVDKIRELIGSHTVPGAAPINN